MFNDYGFRYPLGIFTLFHSCNASTGLLGFIAHIEVSSIRTTRK
jgi:hypothetical protein